MYVTNKLYIIYFIFSREKKKTETEFIKRIKLNVTNSVSIFFHHNYTISNYCFEQTKISEQIFFEEKKRKKDTENTNNKNNLRSRARAFGRKQIIYLVHRHRHCVYVKSPNVKARMR